MSLKNRKQYLSKDQTQQPGGVNDLVKMYHNMNADLPCNTEKHLFNEK